MEAGRVQQAHIEVSPIFQKGFDSLLSRLVPLEGKHYKTSAWVSEEEGHLLFELQDVGNIRRNCPDSVWSAVMTAPTLQ